MNVSIYNRENKEWKERKETKKAVLTKYWRHCKFLKKFRREYLYCTDRNRFGKIYRINKDGKYNTK